MAKIENQRIIIWCNQLKTLQGVILDAVYLALQLEKEICLFVNYRSEEEKKLLYQRSQTYAQTIKKDMKHLDVSTLMLEGHLHDLMPLLGETYNVILFCCGNIMDKQLLKAFYQSPFPFYFWKAFPLKKPRFKKILIPIDFRNSTKDATLWGSYLGRFNNSEIKLLVANDSTDKDLNQKVNKIEVFVKKFYGQFSFPYSMEKGKAGSWRIHKEAIKNSDAYDLLIFTGSINISVIDRLLGPFEKQIVNRCKIPILLTNPQKEMYVLCS